MNPSELIERAVGEGRKALNEAEAKQFLAAYGVSVVEEAVAGTPDEAVARAEALGFPVVLKGLGSRLTHKTERGLVRLNLAGPEAVRRAARDVARAAGEDLEGFLIQPQVAGRREFVAGMFRDDQFGPVVMFGLGGVFTEVLEDTALRLAPLEDREAGQMLDEIRAADLLGPFRGESPADRQALVRTLTGLARVALEHPRVAEIDVNPLVVTPEGRVLAVDALVVLGPEPKPREERPPVHPSRVQPFLRPGSVAFVGASARFDKWGYRLFTNVLAGGYQGQIHLVNRKGGTIAGLPVHRSLGDIPGPVDLGVVTVPAPGVLELFPEFAAKGIKSMLLITSGFSETGPEGRALEERITAEARRHDILIIGPNTMGVTNPHHHFQCASSHARPGAGATAFVSQSGNMGVQLLSFAELQGIGIRAFGGSGNEAMFTIEDALDAFAPDELTRTVLLYVESVKNGRRFYESARRLSRRKPVIVLKGGRTKAGERAAASHTGALASNTAVFNSACRQAGVVLADMPMDLLDLSAAFSSLPLPRGPRVAIMTLGGGWGVVTTDQCAEYGLELPQLPEDLVARIDPLLPPFWSRTNPVDLVGQSDPQLPLKVMEMLLEWDGCDAVINLGIVGQRQGGTRMMEAAATVDPSIQPDLLETVRYHLGRNETDFIEQTARMMERHEKPILGVAMFPEESGRTVYDVEDCRYKSIFYSSPEVAVKALSRLVRYRGWLDAEGPEPA
ncbi:MAG: acetate--CoA ligase family protein [Proteobacteria bacterium]|nr:acetate--CoA ligase family protein [Pseudomonadota bacterium]